MNSPGFLILILAFFVLWFVFARPQRRRNVELARMLEDLAVGDQVVTAGGIYGEVTALHEDEVMVRIAPSLEVRVARRAIGAVIPPDAPVDANASPDPPAPEIDG